MRRRWRKRTFRPYQANREHGLDNVAIETESGNGAGTTMRLSDTEISKALIEYDQLVAFHKSISEYLRNPETEIYQETNRS